MKVLLWIFGIIGFMFALAIGGCAGLLYFATGGVPDYVSVESINKNHGSDIAIINKELFDKKEITKDSFKANQLSNVYGIMKKVKKDRGMSKFEMLYPGDNISLKNYMVSNGSGYGSVIVDGKSTPTVIYEFNDGEQRYRILLKDWGPGLKKEK